MFNHFSALIWGKLLKSLPMEDRDTYLSYIVNIMAADDLAMQECRALIQYKDDILPI